MKRYSLTATANEMLCTGHTREEIVAKTGLTVDYVRRLDIQYRRNLSNEDRCRSLPAPLTDEQAKLAVKAWLHQNEMPVTPRRWTDLQRPGGVTAAGLMAHFGSWATAMRVAGVPYKREQGWGW